MSLKICLVLQIWNSPLPVSGDAKSKAVLPKKCDKVQRSIDPLAEATDIEKLVKEILNKTSTALLAEVTRLILHSFFQLIFYFQSNFFILHLPFLAGNQGFK